MSAAKLPSVLADDKMEIIQAGGSAGVGVRTWRRGLNFEGHLEEWQGSLTHGQALSPSAPPSYLKNTREGKKYTFSPYTTMSHYVSVSVSNHRWDFRSKACACYPSTYHPPRPPPYNFCAVDECSTSFTQKQANRIWAPIMFPSKHFWQNKLVE